MELLWLLNFPVMFNFKTAFKLFLLLSTIFKFLSCKALSNFALKSAS